MIKNLLLLLFLMWGLSTWSNAATFLPRSFEATFEQVYESQVKQKVSKTPIEMKYLYPNNIYYQVYGESPVTYVCNKKRTWKYNPPFIDGMKGEVVIGESSKYCYVKVFDALQLGLKDNKLYKVKLIEKSAIISFEKSSQKQLGLDKVIINFSKKATHKLTVEDLKELELFYPSRENKPVKLVLKTLNTKAPLSEKNFNFQVPSGTNISFMQ